MQKQAELPSNPQTENSGEIGVLYGFRVVLIFMVAQFHFWQQSWLTKSISLFGISFGGYVFHHTGYLFVDGFLLLSGFLLYLPYARRRYTGETDPAISDFYFRRFRRIVPSYYFAVLCSVIFAVVPVMHYLNSLEMIGDLAAHLTFTQVFFTKTNLQSPLNSSLWTVAVEVQFYLIFPFLAKAMKKYAGAVLTGMTMIGLLFRWCTIRFANSSQMLMNQLPAFMDVLALGMLLAMLVAKLEQGTHVLGKGMRVLRGITAISGILIGLIALNAMTNWQYQMSRISYDSLHKGQLMLRLPLCVILGAVMLCSIQLPRCLRFLLDNRLMRFLAGISMNFYFWHQVLAVHLREVFYPNVDELHSLPLQQGAYELLCWCVVLLFAMAVTYGIEKPIGSRLNCWYHYRIARKKPFTRFENADETALKNET